MKESNIQTLLGKLIVEANLPFPMCLELKLEKGKSFAFDKVAEHQLYYLKKSKDGLYYKIPDMYSMDGFAAKKPYDCLWVVSPVTMVVICFYKPRKYKKFYFLDVDDFIALREQSKPKKSVTMDNLDSSPFVSLTFSYPDNLLHKLGNLLQENLS